MGRNMPDMDIPVVLQQQEVPVAVEQQQPREGEWGQPGGPTGQAGKQRRPLPDVPHRRRPHQAKAE